jgi:acyl carrier protein
LRECLAVVIGAEEVDLLKVRAESRLFTELGINSIDMVRVVELVDQNYPVAERLTMWLAEKPYSVLARLTVGDVAEVVCDAVG